jgi:hypothetical protein
MRVDGTKLYHVPCPSHVQMLACALELDSSIEIYIYPRIYFRYDYNQTLLVLRKQPLSIFLALSSPASWRNPPDEARLLQHHNEHHCSMAQHPAKNTNTRTLYKLSAQTTQVLTCTRVRAKSASRGTCALATRNIEDFHIQM